RPGELLDGAPRIGDLDPRARREGGELLDGHDAVVTAVPQQNARRALQPVAAALGRGRLPPRLAALAERDLRVVDGGRAPSSVRTARRAAMSAETSSARSGSGIDGSAARHRRPLTTMSCPDGVRSGPPSSSPATRPSWQ